VVELWLLKQQPVIKFSNEMQFEKAANTNSKASIHQVLERLLCEVLKYDTTTVFTRKKFAEQAHCILANGIINLGLFFLR